MKQERKLKIGIMLMMFGWAFWAILHTIGIISTDEIIVVDTMVAISLCSIMTVLVIFWKTW